MNVAHAKPLAEETSIKLIVSDDGQALVLHRGNFKHDYIWAQYEPEDSILTFITESGKIQHLGLKIHDEFSQCFIKTNEINMIPVDENKNLGLPVSLQFITSTSVGA